MLDPVPAFDYRSERARERLERSMPDPVVHEELEISSDPRWGKYGECFCGSGEPFSRCHGAAIYRQSL